MFDVGMGVVRPYASGRIGIGEISSIQHDADGENLITVMYNDGKVKVYTENAIMKNLGRRIIVTETPI
tara:strand:- start:711 stop:914 length:204 start_codon:yes stop_codon:yes gene_type:complete